MKESFINELKNNHIIAAVKDAENLEAAIESDSKIIFLLSGSIFNLKQIVQKVKSKNKMIFIHVDLLDGFSKDASALKYICEEISPDGIISTKNNILKTAKSMGFLTVQRVFIIDSLSIETAVKSAQTINPDAIEILPGIMPKITKKISETSDIPVIVGGLIRESDEVNEAITNGALGVSTTFQTIWGN